MTDTYTTRDLANALIGKDDKGATREVRKFLRDDVKAQGGKVGTDTPGKGGRYQIEMNKRELNALKKKFLAWQALQAEQAKKRAELKAEEIAAKVVESPIEAIEAIEDESPEGAEEPTTADIDAMIAELHNTDEETIEA